MRGFWLVVAGTAVAVGAAGTVVPLLPATPFVLVGGYAAARASPRFLRWMIRHGTLGPILCAWHRHRAIPRRAKWVAGVGLASSMVVVLVTFDDPRVHMVVLAVLAAVSGYLFTRPER